MILNHPLFANYFFIPLSLSIYIYIYILRNNSKIYRLKSKLVSANTRFLISYGTDFIQIIKKNTISITFSHQILNGRLLLVGCYWLLRMNKKVINLSLEFKLKPITTLHL